MRNYSSTDAVNPQEQSHAERDEQDTALLSALAEGDFSALETLYVRYRPLVMTALRHHGRARPEELEDLCQDVFLSLQTSAASFRHASSPRAFIVGIAVHKAKKLGFVTGLHRRLINRVFGRGEPTAATWGGAVEATHDAQWYLAQLPEPQRVVLLLHRIEHLSAQEIAQSLGISVNTVWTRLHRARQRLRELEEAAP